MRRHFQSTPYQFAIRWSHIGADMDRDQPSKGLPSDVEEAVAQFRTRPTFLMVGTLEPRKGHEQALDAFEQLWQSGVDVSLVIVGQQGWMVQTLVERLRAHPALNKRLVWLEAVSDEYLEKIYAASTCLIAASYGEGFGLPLIEAAKHKLPILARDIPVFREIAGENAFYFKGELPAQMAHAVGLWLDLYRENNHPRSETISWRTWKQSASQLWRCLSHPKVHQHPPSLIGEIS